MPRHLTPSQRPGRRPAKRASRSRRPNRWRPWLVLAGISIGWKVVVFTLGAAVPRWVINDGIAQLPAPLQDYGREARHTALALWDGPIERHGLVRSVRVMSASQAPAPPHTAGSDTAGALRVASAGGECGGRTAVVRAYTYFAIPYSEVRTVCDSGVVEYRVFRRHRTAAASKGAATP
ncbi:MAG: hypothetical protein ACJ79S_01280 [Gemmatimonadaceae bacterium]